MIRLCTICARGGSKGVKNKNIRDLAGKPLLSYSILQAKETNLFDCVAVSSESGVILEMARRHGADILVERPSELATDEAPKLPVIRHCVLEAEKYSGKRFGTIVDLDVTSPLRSINDIHKAVGMLEQGEVSNVITGTPARRSPYFNLVEVNEDGLVKLSKSLPVPVSRRQDAPACYDMNASIYVWRRDGLFGNPSLFNKDTQLYVMPPERSFDIDSELDFRIVEFLMTERGSGA